MKSHKHHAYSFIPEPSTRLWTISTPLAPRLVYPLTHLDLVDVRVRAVDGDTRERVEGRALVVDSECKHRRAASGLAVLVLETAGRERVCMGCVRCI